MELLETFLPQILIVGLLLFGLLTIGVILARMYQRASKETAYVRTGFGGQKVILNGGALVLPVLHEIIPVNMNTLRLEVRRSDGQALITKDRMRVDVLAEFYVRVQPTDESIAAAAQTLGRRTMEPQSLKELVEGKFVDALRSVAAEMAMEELHEQRVQFVNKVQMAVTEDLLKNGLELESVSLTGLDQTSLEHFSPQNAFDAEGLTRLTEQIESRKKQRNDIEQDTQVQIAAKNLQAERQRLEIDRETEYAKLEQQREVEVRKAQQASEIAKERARKEQEAQEAAITAKQKVDLTSIAAERVTDEQRIEKQQKVRERDIGRERAVETSEIERRKAVELAEQDRAIAIAERSRAQSEAQAEADRARALAVQAEEQVTTVREREKAERQKAIELVKAAEEAERDAIGITTAADAEKKAAEDKAEAVRTDAKADADRARITAQGEADAERLAADAAERRYEVEASGKRALHEAANILSNEQVSLQIKLAIVEALPSIIRESAKPMERIEGIRIVQVDGLTQPGRASAADAGPGDSSGGGHNLADDVVRSALRYRAQAPIVDSLLEEVGLRDGLAAQLSDVMRGGNGTPLGHTKAAPEVGRTAEPAAPAGE